MIYKLEPWAQNNFVFEIQELYDLQSIVNLCSEEKIEMLRFLDAEQMTDYLMCVGQAAAIDANKAIEKLIKRK